VDKNKRIIHNILSKTNVAVFCALGMIAGFLVSRYTLSIFTIAFGLNGLRNIHPREWFRNRWWLLGLAWVSWCALSYFWSADTVEWSSRIEVKLPVLLLPLAVSFLPPFSKQQLTVFSVITAVIFLIGAGYSSYYYFADPEYYKEAYRISKVLPTPARNEHIRFSLAIALFINWCIYLLPAITSRVWRWFMAIALVALALYLHLLAARTGLLSFYIILLLQIIYLGWQKSRKLALGLFFLIIVAGAVAVNVVPTLKTRIGYIYYTYVIYKEGQMSGIYSDMGRYISYDVCLKQAKKHLVAGVGLGDIFDEMKAGYKIWYPDVEENRMLLPHNQFLVILLGCGIPGLVLFMLWIFYPLRHVSRTREGFFFFITWFTLILSLVIEPGLEIQHGVFVFLFFLLWQQKQIKDAKLNVRSLRD
jgi:O-antigen ligase